MINSHNNIKLDPPLLNPTTIIAADSENPTKSKRIIQLTGSVSDSIASELLMEVTLDLKKTTFYLGPYVVVSVSLFHNIH